MADPNPASQDLAQIRNLLLLREHARADAWLRKDRRALEALLAPDYIETSSLGTFRKEELLSRLFPVLTLHEFVIEDAVVSVTGGNRAVLDYRCREKLTAGKKEIEGTFRVKATYTREGKQYKLSAWEIRPEA
jgi:hypothetical protein